MSTVTKILAAIEEGDRLASEQLLPLVYDELRRLAAQRIAGEAPGQTLQATALVHEAYMRLVDVQRAGQWQSRGHFFAAAAEAMRRMLVDAARRKKRLKRGGGAQRVPLEHAEPATEKPPEQLLALDEALARLEQSHPEKAAVVKLRYFAGLTIPEAAAALGISTTTANRYWSYARAWLHEDIENS